LADGLVKAGLRLVRVLLYEENIDEILAGTFLGTAARYVLIPFLSIDFPEAEELRNLLNRTSRLV